MKKIFFSIKSGFRERQWDTFRNLPEGFEALLPSDQKPMGSAKKHLLVDHEIQHRSLKRMLLRHLPLLNLRKMPPEADQGDLLYSWQLPFFFSKPFLLELDNPYCVSFYSKKNTQLLKPLILHYFRKANKLVCLSQACKEHLASVYGSEVLRKTAVQYPFCAEREFVPLKRSGPLKFLFVGLQFRLKGGPELLTAFHQIQDTNIELTVISFVPEEIKKKYAQDTRIRFVNPVSREELLSKYFPESDMLVLPTLYESFGMVLLEALSFGLGIIATDVYATKEMVNDQVNGRLLDHPIHAHLFPGETSLQDYETNFLASKESIPKLVESVSQALEEAPGQVQKWKENSRKLFHERFAPGIWRKSFANLLSEGP